LLEKALVVVMLDNFTRRLTEMDRVETERFVGLDETETKTTHPSTAQLE
jgi:hypothetical protein